MRLRFDGEPRFETLSCDRIVDGLGLPIQNSDPADELAYMPCKGLGCLSYRVIVA